MQLFHDYTAKCYYKFMHGNDSYEEEDETFAAKLSKYRPFIWLFISCFYFLFFFVKLWCRFQYGIQKKHAQLFSLILEFILDVKYLFFFCAL